MMLGKILKQGGCAEGPYVYMGLRRALQEEQRPQEQLDSAQTFEIIRKPFAVSWNLLHPGQLTTDM